MKLLKCSECKKYKTLEEFNKDKSDKRGYRYTCKACQKEYMERYNQRPGVKERQKEYMERYNQRPEVKLKHREYMRVRCQRPEVKLKQKEHLQKPEVKLRWKEYSRRYNKRYFKKRRGTDLMFRLNLYIGNAIRISLKGNKNGHRWETLVGFTLIEIIKHLERRFLPGMNWNNYGEWHIDHDIPISSFTFNSPDDLQFKECWSLENLQPLWAAENIKKSNKLIREE